MVSQPPPPSELSTGDDSPIAPGGNHDSEQLLQAILKSSAEAIIGKTLEGTITSWNAGAERIYGYTAAEIIGQSIGRLVPPDRVDEIAQLLERVRGGERVESHETMRQGKDGQPFIASISISPIRDAGGLVVGALTLGRDLTQEKKAEEALRMTQFSVDHAADALYWMAPDGRIVSVNEAACHMLGYTREELLSFGIPAIDPSFVDADWMMVWEDLKTRGTLRLETRHQAKDGQIIPVEITANFIEFGGKEYSCAFVRDITERQRAEAALREAKEYLAKIINAVGDPIFVKDRQHRFVLVNDAQCRLIGLPREELLGKTDYDFLPKEQVDIFWAMDERVFATGQENINEEQITDARGNVLTIITTKTLYQDKAGNPYIVGILKDITERKKMEEALRESEEALRIIFNSVHSAILTHTLEGVILDVNEPFLQMYGLSREQTRGLTITEISGATVPMEQAPVIWRKVLAGEPQCFEWKGRRLDNGEEFDNETFLRRIRLHGQDVIIANVRDITERKRAEQALRESRRKYQTIFDQSPIAIEFYDAQGRLMIVNQSCLSMFGVINPEEIKEFSIFDDPNIPSEAKMTLATGKPIRLEADFSFDLVRELNLYQTTRQGRVRLDWILSPILDEGCVIGYIEQIQDITERTRLEEQLRQAQKMESVGRLAGGVAHDFNNMLQVIQGHTDLALAQCYPGDPIMEDLQEIRQAAERSANLTRQLLAFARKQTVSPRVVDLNDLVTATQKMLRRLIGEDITLAWAPGADIWQIKVDPSQIDQILANLVVNARDALGTMGTITLETANVVCDDAFCTNQPGLMPGEYVRLAVSDTGAGMDQETMEHIFEPFFTTKEMGKGTGLGLATVYGIVRQNNGFIHVDSEPGRGTTIKIYLHRFMVAVNADPAVATEQQAQTGTETVLMVEDEELILRLGKTLLERHGYTVLAAGTPAESIALAEQYEGPIHLLLTDVVMPEMNGKELHERLSALRPEMKTLYMSGYTADIIARSGVLEAGVQFIQKPFSMRLLAKKVRQVIDEKSDAKNELEY